MIKEEVLPYAYTEVIEILKYISEEYVRNIPKEIIEYFQEKSKKDYEYTVTEFDTFENQEMLYETRVILSILYRDYFVSEEVKTKIIQKEYIEMQIIEKEKSNNYNIDDIFKRNKKENITGKKSNQLSVSKTKGNFFTNIINSIKRFFKEL